MVVVSMCDTSGDAPVFWRAEEDEQMRQSGLVCNFDYLQGPGCKIWMYCAVFSLLIYVASLSRKKKLLISFAFKENHEGKCYRVSLLAHIQIVSFSMTLQCALWGLCLVLIVAVG